MVPKASSLVALTAALALAAGPRAATPAGAPGGQDAAWRDRLEARLRAMAPEPGSGHLAVHVEDLSTGVTASLGGGETCYLASGVKIPIALEVLAQAEEGRLDLRRCVRIEAADMIDGSPVTSRLGPGAGVSLGELLEHALIASDNTASDLLIREVGLEAINARVRRLVPEGFGEITTLAEVRRRAYSGIFPEASGLTNPDFTELDEVEDSDARVQRLAEILHARPEDACTLDLDEAYSEYYSTGVNSATLQAQGALLRAIAHGDALGPESTARLLDVMRRATTGRRRIRAGLPREVEWAHKTGTQRSRVGDFGIAWPRSAPGHRVVIAAVASGFPSQAAAERALRQVGEAVAASGVLAVSPLQERRP